MAALVSKQAVFSGRVRSQAPSRARVVVQASYRPLWLPGGQVPAHLDGKLPGDFGFDPLGLGKEPEALKWYVAAEVFHCRVAMSAVAGILIPGLLTKAGALSVPEWYEAGKVSNDTSGIPFGALLAVQLFMSGFVETKRWQEIRKPGSQAEKGTFLGFESAFAGTGNPSYPGGIFDPLGFSRQGEEKLNDYKWKEIRNGRLAMLAFLGFSAQYVATGKGPLDNLADHLANPLKTTFADNGVSVPFFF